METAAENTYGYPYLIQLIGYYIWENLSKNFPGDLLNRVLIEAKDRMFRNVHQLVFDKLSLKDKEFLYAMTEDHNQSLNKDISVRLGKDKNYISMYRARLIARGIVSSTGYGTLSYTYPYMREFLIEKKREMDW